MVETLRISKRQGSALVAAVMLLLATIVPALVSAAQVTERSIALSSSSANADDVVYNVGFTAVAGAGAFVVEFCDNTSLLGEACDPPVGFDVSDATVSGSFTKNTDETTENRFVATGTISAGVTSFTLTGVDNPTATGPLYARIVTYANEAASELYDSADPGTHVDDGGVAMSITNTVGVSAAVLESMTFCVAKNTISANCDLTSNPAPTLELGEDVGDGVIALSSADLSTGDIFTQISTNAATGAIVNLKSNAEDCGGLLRAGAPTACDIAPAGITGTFDFGTAKFGVKVANDTDPTGVTPAGTFRAATGSAYDDTNYRLNGAADNLSGVTSTYGDPFLDTDGAPINNRNMKLTFAASIANNTPAGKYSADLSLIATGKF